MSSDEPEYLKALRRSQEQRKATEAHGEAGGERPAGPTPAQREAMRWAREIGGKEVRISPIVPRAKVAALVQPITPFGTPPVTLEWHVGREDLAERVKAAQGAGENVLGCFELTTGRPLTAEVKEGRVVFTPGSPRQIMKAESPERMVRLASKQAQLEAKTRKLGDHARGGGGGGGGGGGRGRSGGGGRRGGGAGR